MKELVGKTVREMFVNEDQSLLKFTLDDGEQVLIYETEGDCCSETWFADILFGHNFFGKIVTEVSELDVPEWLDNLLTNDGRTRQEYDRVYGYQVVCGSTSSYKYASNGSSCDIIFRNSSNGYYGGSCSLMDTSPAWSKKKLEEAQWTQIINDWQA